MPAGPHRPAGSWAGVFDRAGRFLIRGCGGQQVPVPSPALSLLLFLILQGPLPGQAVWEETQGHGEAVPCAGTLKPRCQTRKELQHPGQGRGADRSHLAGGEQCQHEPSVPKCSHSTQLMQALPKAST